MASSDEEGDVIATSASDYEFMCGRDEPISFARLPIEWKKDEALDGNRRKIFLSGKTDNGLRKIYKQVIAWKFNLMGERPEIFVLSVGGNWIKLLKPRKAFMDIVRTILVTVYFLHFARRNPEKSQKALWDYLNKEFSILERRPSEDDMVDHMALINEVAERDEILAKSKLLTTFLLEKPKKKKTSYEDLKRPFIVDDNDESEDPEVADKSDGADEDIDEDDCFDSVCAICDNGGHIYLCEGRCMRSFHATVADGEESNCDSLNLTDAELEELKSKDFYCNNCLYKKHQCFACGELGSSDVTSPEVFKCVNGACGHFYHPRCVAKLLHPRNSMDADEQCQKIVAGEQFACPVHKCHVCQGLEVRTNEELQFAVCRRCPRAYHRKCMPRDLPFEDDLDEDGEVMQRAWKGLIPNRILIYCLDHEIDPLLFTPPRTHLKFPGPQRKKVKSLSLESSKKVGFSNSRSLSFRDSSGSIYGKAAKGIRKLSAGSKQGELLGSRMVKVPDQAFSRKLKVASNRKVLQKSKSSLSANEAPLGDRLFETFFGMDAEADESCTGADASDEHGKNEKVKPIAKRTSDSVTLDEESMKSILDLMKDASDSITLDDIKRDHKPPSTHAHSNFSDENVTLGKVEGSVQAVRAAVEKLNRGGSLEDAKAVCGKDLLVQMLRWRDKFKVHLSPFLYGMRYTSFGRHFTKVDKLQQIVDMLHCYIEDGDMLVDFCCGSNDFSCLMKTKLDSIGKRCSFKNYDILQAKNDFNFEKRDWMTVRRNELPNGSRLIMGLNPPFGVNAMLANKFINKALEFKPKLVILIVPRETEGLDKKKPPYDLVWEDDHMFVGKSFYLPGSVDKNDKQIEDWNVSAPVLYLWSRQDWTRKHKDIAEQHHHSPGHHNDDIIPQDSDMEIDNSTSSREILTNNEQLIATAGDDEAHEDKASDKQDQTSNVTHQEAKHQEPNNAEDDKISAQSHKSKATHQEGTSVAGDSISKQVKSNTRSANTKSGGKRKRKGHSTSNVQKNSAFHKEQRSVNVGSVDKRNPPKPHQSTSQVHSGKHEHPQLYQRYPHEMRDESLDDVVRMYLNTDQAYPSMPSGSSPYAHSGGMRTSSEPWINHPQESSSSAARRSYDREMNNQLLSAAGSNSWNQMSSHQSYRRPSYVQPGNSNYGELHGSTVQRFAPPRLNELSQGTLNQMGHGPRGPQYPMGPYRDPAPQPGGGLGFAPGPPRPFPSSHSSGWLNE